MLGKGYGDLCKALAKEARSWQANGERSIRLIAWCRSNFKIVFALNLLAPWLNNFKMKRIGQKSNMEISLESQPANSCFPVSPSNAACLRTSVPFYHGRHIHGDQAVPCKTENLRKSSDLGYSVIIDITKIAALKSFQASWEICLSWTPPHRCQLYSFTRTVAELVMFHQLLRENARKLCSCSSSE